MVMGAVHGLSLAALPSSAQLGTVPLAGSTLEASCPLPLPPLWHGRCSLSWA